jgi:CHASE3 domain sensor protein
LQHALTTIPVDLAELRRLTADDPAQQSRVGALASLVTETLTALRNDKRRPLPELLDVSARSEQLTRQVRTLTDSLRVGQLSLLKRGNERMLAAKKLVMTLFSAGSAVLLLLLVVGSRQIDENMRARREAEAVRAGLAAIVNSSEDRA